MVIVLVVVPPFFAKNHRIISGAAKISDTRLALSIILSQLNDFNRSLKSSQAPGPLVNCSSAALLRYHYVRNNFDVEWIRVSYQSWMTQRLSKKREKKSR